MQDSKKTSLAHQQSRMDENRSFQGSRSLGSPEKLVGKKPRPFWAGLVAGNGRVRASPVTLNIRW
jgi:hypothetical protein